MPKRQVGRRLSWNAVVFGALLLVSCAILALAYAASMVVLNNPMPGSVVVALVFWVLVFLSAAVLNAQARAGAVPQRGVADDAE